MPDLDGPSLVAALRELHPELARRVVLITGDVLGAEFDDVIPRRGPAVLEKPLDIARPARSGAPAPGCRVTAATRIVVVDDEPDLRVPLRRKPRPLSSRGLAGRRSRPAHISFTMRVGSIPRSGSSCGAGVRLTIMSGSAGSQLPAAPGLGDAAGFAQIPAIQARFRPPAGARVPRRQDHLRWRSARLPRAG